MKITQALFISGLSAFYFDDQRAIKNGAQADGFGYRGQVQTAGFHGIRQAGEAISVVLKLDNGSIALGDCAAVQYSGAGGRDPLFLNREFVPFLERYLRPLLEGREVNCFLDNARYVDTLAIDGHRLHTAIRYGLTQALLDAAALANNITKAEVLCEEYQLPVVAQPIPLFGQSGDDRYQAVDKMILKRIDALPHGLINNIPDKLGYRGQKLQDYLGWLVQRIETFGGGMDGGQYRPDLHIDVYGTIGQLFENNLPRMVDYLASLGEQAGSLNLYIEGPVDMGGKDSQIEMLAELKRALNCIGSGVQLVADEWCNTLDDIVDFTDASCCHMVQIKTPDLGSVHNVVEAVLYCQRNGMQAYQGGTCNETDISARTCVHLALAARPTRLLVKPGMGFDEGMNIVTNEMRRTLSLLHLAAPGCNQATHAV